MLHILTDNPDIAFIHVVGMNELSRLVEYARKYPQYNQIIAFRPTGWTFHQSQKPNFITSNIVSIPIAYSEHSSYDELKYFVQNLDVDQIIPTVNVWRQAEMNLQFSNWTREIKK